MCHKIFAGQRFRSTASHAIAAFALVAAIGFATAAVAQSSPVEANPLAPGATPQYETALALPDAPGEVQTSSSFDAAPLPGQNSQPRASQPATLPEASHRDRYPLPGQPAPVLSPGDKGIMGLQGALSPYALIGWLASAGYEHATNSSPNYGTDRGAFGQRLGASAIRAVSEDVLADSVLAPAFHEDPRYYRLGNGHNFFARAVYAATRAVITRDDDGRTVPNFSQIGGNLIGAALTNAYYPQSNRTVSQTMETFGGSLGGTALGDAIAEFFGGILFDHHH